MAWLGRRPTYVTRDVTSSIQTTGQSLKCLTRPERGASIRKKSLDKYRDLQTGYGSPRGITVSARPTGQNHFWTNVAIYDSWGYGPNELRLGGPPADQNVKESRNLSIYIYMLQE